MDLRNSTVCSDNVLVLWMDEPLLSQFHSTTAQGLLPFVSSVSCHAAPAPFRQQVVEQELRQALVRAGSTQEVGHTQQGDRTATLPINPMV